MPAYEVIFVCQIEFVWQFSQLIDAFEICTIIRRFIRRKPKRIDNEVLFKIAPQTSNAKKPNHFVFLWKLLNVANPIDLMCAGITMALFDSVSTLRLAVFNVHDSYNFSVSIMQYIFGDFVVTFFVRVDISQQ